MQVSRRILWLNESATMKTPGVRDGDTPEGRKRRFGEEGYSPSAKPKAAPVTPMLLVSPRMATTPPATVEVAPEAVTSRTLWL